VKPIRSLLSVLALVALVASAVFAAACGDDDDDAVPDPTAGDPTAATTATLEPGEGTLILYSGRSESLVAPIIEMFEKETGIHVQVKYGGTTELAALLAEEGSRSPADVYFAQDAGALGALQKLGLLAKLPEDVLDAVDPKYRSQSGELVGITGRARVIVYNPDLVAEADLPDSILDLAAEKWRGKVGWAPTNASFQAQVTAFRVLRGDAAAEEWLRAMKANGTRDYPGNSDIVSAVAAGEVAVGLVNHYYLWGFVRDQGEGFKARNHYTAAGDIGSLVNVAGAGVLASSKNSAAALQFIRFMLGEEGQRYFAEKTFEYPLVRGIAADPRLVALAEIDPPHIDLSDIDDLQGTLDLLRKTGVLP
jgi:iron(III) transport system substrate-binding protein